MHLFTDASPSTSSGELHDGGDEVQIQEHLLWDRKAEGGFPGMSFLSLFGSNFVFEDTHGGWELLLEMGLGLCLRMAANVYGIEVKELKRRVRDVSMVDFLSFYFYNRIPISSLLQHSHLH